MQADLVSSGRSGVVRALRVVRGASPFLQVCLNNNAVGARFPTAAPGESVVRWRGRVVEGQGVLEPVD